MADSVIQVEGAGKSYRIVTTRNRYRTLRQAVSDAAGDAFRRAAARLRGRPMPGRRETFWALRDVSFEVPRGQVLGIIGRNGAGKSTLLKILSRITEPTEGSLRVRGRLASILEVGTGFHPELTGRENVYLNGAILGMRRAEIDRKFDEIVAFSEVEKFLETPVKHYSSGMFVRLAFAVAAHLEPRILLIDEVLAVGDAEFQKKCLGKMGSVAQEGRTVLFVSHQMNAIRALCEQCLWLDGGRVARLGPTEEVVKEYLGRTGFVLEWLPREGDAPRDPYFTPLRLTLVDEALQPVDRPVRSDERIGVLAEGDVERSSPAFALGIAVYAPGGELLFWALHTDGPPDRWPALQLGRNRLVAWIPGRFLNEGTYRVELVSRVQLQGWILQPGHRVPSILVEVRGRQSESPNWIRPRPGLTAPELAFERLDGPLPPSGH
jgi:lipopolysaccharide transport system ATP-binding protein